MKRNEAARREVSSLQLAINSVLFLHNVQRKSEKGQSVNTFRLTRVGKVVQG